MNKIKEFFHRFAGKGYYIALILCAAAIGLTGYLYYRSVSGGTDAEPDVAVNAPVETNAPTGAPAGEKEKQPAGDTTKPALKTGLPLAGETTVDYSMDALSYNPTTRDWRVHDGVDIAAEAGTAVCAAAAGEVYTVYDDEIMGTTVVLRHEGGYVTTYSSLDEKVEVAAGDAVTLGQPIGTVGSSAALETAIGDHLHFSVRCDDESMDPMAFLNQN